MSGIVFENLKLLRNDMEEKNWKITGFRFKYKDCNFIVLVKLDDKSIRSDNYYIAKLCFRKLCNNEKLEVYADSFKLYKDAKTIREYFNIEWSEKLGTAFNTLYEALSNSIPSSCPGIYDDREIKFSIVNDLSRADGEDENKIYYCDIKRNGCYIDKNGDLKYRQRTFANEEKTKILYPEIYEIIKEDKDISVCYSCNKEDEKNENYAENKILNWQNR